MPVAYFGIIYSATFVGVILGSYASPRVRKALHLTPRACYVFGCVINAVGGVLLLLFSLSPISEAPTILSQVGAMVRRDECGRECSGVARWLCSSACLRLRVRWCSCPCSALGVAAALDKALAGCSTSPLLLPRCAASDSTRRNHP